jgi:hypothetical protein
MGLGNKPSSGFAIIRTWNNWINDFYLWREGLIFTALLVIKRFIRLPVLLKSYPALSLSAPVPS